MRLTPELREEHVLADGGRVTIRPIRPSDAEQLRRGFEHLSPASRHQRFVAPPRELDDETLRYLTDVDLQNHVAIVATMESPDLKEERGLGVARFVRLEDDPTCAEAAVVVVDEAQRRGIGRLLLTALADAARERGIHTFRAQTLASNTAMRAILAEAGATIREGDGDTIEYDVALDAGREVDDSLVRRLLRAAGESLSQWLVPGRGSRPLASSK